MARTARNTLDYVLREMTSPDGGFFSTQDADSEGVEGKFYVWSKEEIQKALGDDLAERFCQVYQVSQAGNWEGHNILHTTETLSDSAHELSSDTGWLDEELALARRKLFALREGRIKPFRDEKILAAWNGLMIESFAKAYQILEDERYLVAAQRAADFILEKLTHMDKGRLRLYHAHKDGSSRFNAYLDDYAALLGGLISLYESDFDVKWLKKADALAGTLVEQFWEESKGTFFYTSRDHESLILRPQDKHDGALPSGASLAVTHLIRVGLIKGKTELLKVAETAMETQLVSLRMIPRAVGQLLIALQYLMDSPLQIVVAPGKDGTEEELRLIRGKFLPNKVVCLNTPEARAEIHPLVGKNPIGDRTTIYFCKGMTCDNPVVGLEELEKKLSQL